MSGADMTFAFQKLIIRAEGATCYGLQNLPVELLIDVMKHLPDMAALSKLFTAELKTLTVFKGYSNDIVASIVENMSPELRNSALDVLAIRSHPPVHPSRITHFIKHHLNAEFSYDQLRSRSYSLPSLLDLIRISESIESLTESFAHDRVLGPCINHNTPLSPIELHRIQRSFWRFQLCYDVCHPEHVNCSQESYDVQSRSTRRYVQYQTSQPHSGGVPNWLQDRSDAYRPEALSRFIPNLSCWELDELEAIRFHLAHQVNTLQYHRSCGSEDMLIQQPVLLQRLIRDIDHWDTRSPTDHVLVASFRQSMYAQRYPIVWDRFRHLYEASSPNTPRRFAIQVLQDGQPQWGWCLWDEKRLVKRGLIDMEYEDLAKKRKVNDESQSAKLFERRAVIGRAHSECAASQYTALDRRIAAQYHLDKHIHADRLKWDTIWELGREGREWMPTDLDSIYSCGVV